jgi:hypothetical protein
LGAGQVLDAMPRTWLAQMDGDAMNANNISVGITGFIDILGFSDKVLNAETLEDIVKIRTDIETIQGRFNFDTKDEFLAKTQQLNDSTILAFSDCVVVNIPLQSETAEYSGTFDPLIDELVNFAYAQGACVLSGLFIRGGLELGWWFRKQHTLVSQSMVGAVRREQNAVVPIIALGPRIYEYFRDHQDRPHYSKDADPVRKLFLKYSSEHDQFYFIDYIRLCLQAVGWQLSTEQMVKYKCASPEEMEEITAYGYGKNIDHWLRRHARNIEVAASAETSEKVMAKYAWLSSYHNEVVREYTANPECICNISSTGSIEEY